MAKRGKRGAAAPARATKATSRRAKPSAPAAAEVEIVEEQAGEGIDTGIAVVTTVILLAAILFVDALLGHSGAGMFF